MPTDEDELEAIMLNRRKRREYFEALRALEAAKDAVVEAARETVEPLHPAPAWHRLSSIRRAVQKYNEAESRLRKLEGRDA